MKESESDSGVVSELVPMNFEYVPIRTLNEAASRKSVSRTLKLHVVYFVVFFPEIAIYPLG